MSPVFVFKVYGAAATCQQSVSKASGRHHFVVCWV